MRAQINAANTEAGPILEEASSLMSQRTENEKKQQLLDAFKHNFLISDAETVALTSTAEPVNEEFFRVLNRVKKIHRDCQVLLSSADQTLGLEILEQSSKQLNAGYQKLYRWVQREFKSLDLENPQINASIRRSLRVLAERPTLFQSCLDFFAEAREHTLSDAFYAALTGQSAGGDEPHQKPIELHAHDPLRYVGDMLAWTHSSAVSEREALEVLFVDQGDEMAANLRAGAEAEPWNRPTENEDAEEEFDPKKALNDLVGRDIAGVARVLRQRVEQVVQSHEDATLAYKVANLMQFYRRTFIKLLGDGGVILETLSNLDEFATRQFRVNMRDHVASVQQTETLAAPSSDDLGAPDFFEDALSTLRQLLKSYDSSLAAISDPSTREEAFTPVLAEALDSFLSLSASMAKRIEEPYNDIFMLNCLLSVRKTLLPYSFVTGRLRQTNEAINTYASNLTEYQHRFFLHTSGLASLLQPILSLPSFSGPMTMLELPAFSIDSLARASQELDDFLPSALMDAKDNVRQLRDARMAAEVTEDAAERFCRDYEVVEGKLMEADEHLRGQERKEGDGEIVLLRDAFPRTVGEIRVLLS